MRRSSNTTWAIEGARNSSLDRRIDALEEAASGGGGTSITAPTLCAGSFYIVGADERLKRGVRATFCVEVPAGTIKIRTVIIKVSDASTAASYGSKRINDAYEITDSRTHLEYKFTPLLDYGTQYRLIRIVAIGEDGPRTFFPLAEQIFSDVPPAAMLFTTPEQYGAPPLPALADIDTKLDPETDGYDAYAFITNRAPLNVDTGAVQTYRQAGITWIQNVISRDYGGTTGVAKIPEKTLLTEADLDATDPAIPGRGMAQVKFRDLVPGGNYALIEATVHSGEGGKRTTTGSVAFVAGSLTRAIAALTNVDVVFVTVEPFDDGNWVDVALEFTQPWPGPVSLRHFTQDYKKTTVTDWTLVGEAKDERPQKDLFHKQVNAGTISIGNGSTSVNGVGTQMTRWEVGWKIKVGAQTLVVAAKPTSDTAATVTTPSVGAVVTQAYTMVMRMALNRIKVKPNRSYNHSVRLNARGEDQTTILDTIVVGADGHVTNDTTRPATIAAPICQAFTDGNVKVEAEIPADQIHTISKYRFHMSTSNTAPDRDAPAEGVATVVKLKKGHLFVMFQRPLTDISSITYYFGVQALNDLGWSEWSPRTSVLGTEIGRPLTDVIGNGVPTLPIGLERSATGGTSGNSTTTYVLDASASAVDSFYVGMHLHIPSLAAANRIRKITAYVASTKTVTVDVAWSVTPGNSLAFEIHRGLEVGEKSGTASGVTTTVVLGASASGADDAYTGMAVYLPASASADQIRKITDYVGATKTATLETALSVAIATNDCYAISKGSFGYAAINPFSGIITGVPARIWLDSDTTEDVVEVVMPTGENAFSVQTIQILMYKKNNGIQRDAFKGNVNATPTYRFKAPSGYTPVFRLRFQNLYRDGGSDGWSSYTYYFEGYSSAATANYDPAAFPPIEVDYQDTDSYPSSRYDTY